METAEQTTWAISADTIDGLDLADPGREGQLETIDIGTFEILMDRYVRLASEDLVLVADALRRLADRIIDATIDVREESAATECPYCPTIIDDGDPYCGSHDCRRQYELDLIGSDR